jgi:nucleoid-associated protein YgaU
MPKDLKIGLFLGLALTISAVLWLATRPSLSPIARISRAENSVPRSQYDERETKNEDVLRAEDGPSSHRIQGQDGLATRGQSLPPAEAGNARDKPPGSAQYEQAEKIKPQKFHIVLKGQTLTTISLKYYGTAGNWQKILDYNRNIIKDPNKLIPGTKLIIPD